MTYRINTNTAQLIEDNNNLGPNFYSEGWREADEGEVNNFLLLATKDSKKLEINQARDAAIYANITITTENSGSQTFSSFKNISGELNFAIRSLQKSLDNGEPTPTIRFPSVDNKIVAMTISDYKAIESVLESRVDYYAQGRELKDLVLSKNTIDEVNNINIEFN